MIWYHLIFSTHHTFDVILGHILFRMWFIDLHGVAQSYPFTRYTPRRWHVCYLIMIPQWSLFGAIQLDPHFSAFGCRHASYFESRFLDVWVLFGLRRSHIWWWMISCHSIFDLPYIWCHTRAYFVSDEIYRSSWSCMLIPTYKIHAETMTCLLSNHDPPIKSLWTHLVRLAFFGT